MKVSVVNTSVNSELLSFLAAFRDAHAMYCPDSRYKEDGRGQTSRPAVEILTRMFLNPEASWYFGYIAAGALKGLPIAPCSNDPRLATGRTRLAAELSLICFERHPDPGLPDMVVEGSFVNSLPETLSYICEELEDYAKSLGISV